MLPERAVARCAALLAGSTLVGLLTLLPLEGVAAAQDAAAAVKEPLPQSGFVERVRVSSGYRHEQRDDAIAQDLFLAVAPEISLLVLDRRWQLRTTYGITGTMHTQTSAELSNRLGLASTFELSRRTTLLLSVDAAQTTVSNILVAGSAANSTVTAVPVNNSYLLSLGASEGTSYEASPVVRLGQGVFGGYVTSLDAIAPFDNYLVGTTLTADRSWRNDAVGVELSGTYAITNPPPPSPDQRLVVLTLAPRWRHDLTRSLSSSISGGPTFAFSPDPGTTPVVGPFARASLLYLWQDARVEAVYAHGFAPNVTTGQLLRSDVVSVQGQIPLSSHNRVYAGASVGHLAGKNLVLRDDAVGGENFNAVLVDLDVSWAPLLWMQLFARYQFLAQTSGAARVGDPPLIRNAVVIGAQFSSAPPGRGGNVPTSFPQRVDRGDAPK